MLTPLASPPRTAAVSTSPIMSLTSNPFRVLGATPRDDRRRIIALANDKRLDSDEAAVREAQSILTTPRKRLAAEIAWLPGVEAEETRQVLATMDEHPDTGLRMDHLPALPRANLLADGLVRAGSATVSSHGLAVWIVELASAHERIRPDSVTTAVNEARSAAGVPIASQQDVAEGLRNRRGHYADAMEQCLDGMSLSPLVKVVTAVVNFATEEGARHAPVLIDNLVDSYYERRVNEKMALGGKQIATLVSQVRGHVGSGTLVRVRDVVAQIESRLREWDIMAQPIQVSLASRGMSHPPSSEIMHEVRELAVELFNKHGLLEVAHGLTETLREVFAEMEPITEVLDKDVSTLDGIAKRVDAAPSRRITAPARPHRAHTARPRVARPALWTALGRYVPGCVILIFGVMIANSRQQTDRPETSVQNTVSDPLQELFKRMDWLLTGKGNPDPAWVQESYERGTADDYVRAGERIINFLRSTIHGAIDVPVDLIKSLGIVASVADLGKTDQNQAYRVGRHLERWLDNSTWASQDPRLRVSFLSNQLPYFLGQVLAFLTGGWIGAVAVALGVRVKAAARGWGDRHTDKRAEPE